MLTCIQASATSSLEKTLKLTIDVVRATMAALVFVKHRDNSDRKGSHQRSDRNHSDTGIRDTRSKDRPKKQRREENSNVSRTD